MSDTLILSGKDAAGSVYADLTSRIESVIDKGKLPGLAAVWVGDDPASRVYVRSKTKRFRSMGLHSNTITLREDVPEIELLQTIKALNHDKNFHGILVQLPLPKHINSQNIIESILPEKDVDSFHPQNVGLLTMGRPRYVPCTPKGIMRLLSHYGIDLSGKHVVVIGRSNIVGRPVSILTSLKTVGANATSTVCHSGTKDITYHTQQADVVVTAMGSPNYLKGDMLKNDSVIIDVGINRIEADNENGYKIVGDVQWDSIQGIASAATPVPGGVGPMTIAMLVENTVEAAESAI
jgi:methylenetetrahydrofolate dehydrogenase (NADP+)/methenyltetrahydrofolate cyclohydrolase